ncbi:hypothetical protein ACIBI9_65840 [Nonomuraea sp. NPDC050451]|uniref:hypothetical protein n=1 Tax=Nonomuraea TaxID=83681 RepID=UPI0033FEC056
MSEPYPDELVDAVDLYVDVQQVLLLPANAVRVGGAAAEVPPSAGGEAFGD